VRVESADLVHWKLDSAVEFCAASRHHAFVSGAHSTFTFALG
jgi:hypothetical protein